jgi:hypothetical protein
VLVGSERKRKLVTDNNSNTPERENSIMLDTEKVSFIFTRFWNYSLYNERLSFIISLSLNNQLIRSIDGIASPSSLGIPLPSTFTPMSMSIIDSNDKAVLLISDCVETIFIFQFQRSFSGDELTINSSLALHGGVNPGVENVFMASASFQFDLAHTGTQLRPCVLQHTE